jgi:hypothetical protein
MSPDLHFRRGRIQPVQRRRGWVHSYVQQRLQCLLQCEYEQLRMLQNFRVTALVEARDA